MSASANTPYNYPRFRPRHLVSDIAGSYQLRGVQPGDAAPDFELGDTDGRLWRLSEHLDKPVLLHFGSYT